MIKKHFLARTLFFLFVLGNVFFCVQKTFAVTYTEEDSLKVVQLLSEGRRLPRGTNLVLYYAHRFESVPYVASTLEVNEEEQLVVNLRELDCTTYVETVLALTLATHGEVSSWDTFCDCLEKIRYSHGKCNGYPSRNHYFSQWVQSNEDLGIVSEQICHVAQGKQKLDLHYMSRHPMSYAMLKEHPDLVQKIRINEKQASGKTIRYIPCNSLGMDKKRINCIEDGDILAIVTKKDGLDVCHLGFAEWAEDGCLHLLNASSIHKKVVLESQTLQHYMIQHPSQLGVRVVRILSSR